MSQQVADLDYDFEDLLSEAESNARGAWEEDFTDGVRDKFDEYGDRMYLSDRQEDVLKRIAKW